MTKLSTLISFIFSSLFLFAQPGVEDQHYNTKAFHKSIAGPVYSMVIQNDDRIIIVGDITSTSNTNKYIYRINPDRTIDSSFLAGTGVNKAIYSILFQQDGKILVGGDFEVFDGQNAGGIIRLLPDGQIDNSFTTGVGAFLLGQSGKVRDVFLQNDGKIIVTGDFDQFNGVSRNRIVRLNSDGTIDLSFDPGVGVTANGDPYIYDVEILANGKLIIGGNFSQVSGSWFSGIARLNSDGSVDNTFHDTQTGVVFDIEMQGNSIIACGYFSLLDANTNFHSPNIARFSINGYVDPSFISPYLNASMNIGYSGRVLKVMDDMSIFAAFDSNITHMNPNGSFLYNGNQLFFLEGINNQTPVFFDFEFNSANQLIAGGNFNSSPLSPNMANGITYITPYVNTDSTANGMGVTSNYGCWVYDLVIDPTNKTTIVGQFEAYNAIHFNGIAKLLENGQIDTSFHCGTGFDLSSEGPRTIAKQADGKMIIGGVFNDYNNIPHRNLIRIHPNGEADENFTSTLNLNSFYPENVIVEPTGKIIVAGNGNAFSSNGASRSDIIRLNIDGTLDTTFNAGTAVNQSNPAVLKTLARQQDGKYLIGGLFTTFNNQTHKGLVRLNQNGSIDTSFHIGSGFLSTIFGSDYHVNSISVQYDNKILVGGNFINYNGTNVNQLVRLNTNGSLDTTFSNSTTSYFNVQKTVQQPNGKIMVLVLPTNSTFSDLSILNSDGTLAMDFSTPTIYNASNFGIQTDGKVIVTSAGYQGNEGQFNWPYNNITQGVTRFDNETDFLGALDLAIQTTTSLTCQNIGTAIISPVNGNAPFLYSWENGLPTTDSSFVFNTPGIYTATVIDSLGNSVQATVLLNGPINNPAHDLTGNIVTTSFRPGFLTPIYVDAYNKTCTPVNGQLKLLLDTDLTVISSTPVPDQIVGDTLIWNLSNIAYSNTHFTALIQTEVSVNAQIGDSINIFLLSDPIIQDADSTDNLRNYIFPVLNGYDPNDKKVYPIGNCIPHFIDTNQRLTYTVRFQNTGNSEAVNLYVLDDLSEHLDVNSLQIVGSSHPMYTIIEPNNRVRFKFDNIHLPDSLSAGNESIGYVIFTISLNDNVSNQSLLTNQASIYFDYNDPIITNSVFNTIVDEIPNQSVQSISEIACNSFLWNGNLYTESGNYYFNGQNFYGCDSIIELNLTVISNIDSSLEITGIDSITVNDITYYTSGTYYQSIINPVNNCSQELTIIADLDYTSFQESQLLNYELYPNPFNSEILLKIQELNHYINYQVINSVGKIMLSPVKITKELTHIDTQSLSSGIYFLLIDFGTHKTITKMEKY